MATESFRKEFVLKSEREVKSFIEIWSNEHTPIYINREMVSEKREKEGIEKLRKILNKVY